MKDKLINTYLEKGETRLLDLIMKTGCFNDTSRFKFFALIPIKFIYLFGVKGLAKSMIENGGVQLNNTTLTSPDLEITQNHILPNNTTIIRIGNHF